MYAPSVTLFLICSVGSGFLGLASSHPEGWGHLVLGIFVQSTGTVDEGGGTIGTVETHFVVWSRIYPFCVCMDS